MASFFKRLGRTGKKLAKGIGKAASQQIVKTAGRAVAGIVTGGASELGLKAIQVAKGIGAHKPTPLPNVPPSTVVALIDKHRTLGGGIQSTQGKPAKTMPGGAPIGNTPAGNGTKSAAMPGGARLAATAAGGFIKRSLLGASAAKGVRAAKGKKPCKYGARVNGRCPPKPKTARGGASAFERKAVSTGVSTARKIGRGAVGGALAATGTRAGRKALAATGRAIAARAATTAAAAAPFAAAGGALVGGALLQRATVNQLAEDRVRAVESKLGKLPAATRKKLKEQHVKQARKDLTLRAPSYLR